MIEAAAACVRHSAAKRPRMALVILGNNIFSSLCFHYLFLVLHSFKLSGTKDIFNLHLSPTFSPFIYLSGIMLCSFMKSQT